MSRNWIYVLVGIVALVLVIGALGFLIGPAWGWRWGWGCPGCPMMGPWGWGFGGMGWGIGLLMMLVGLLIPLLILGLIIAAVVGLVQQATRSGGPSVPATPTARCPQCGRPVQSDWTHCPYCGASLTGSPS